MKYHYDESKANPDQGVTGELVGSTSAGLELEAILGKENFLSVSASGGGSSKIELSGKAFLEKPNLMAEGKAVVGDLVADLAVNVEISAMEYELIKTTHTVGNGFTFDLGKRKVYAFE